MLLTLGRRRVDPNNRKRVILPRGNGLPLQSPGYGFRGRFDAHIDRAGFLSVRLRVAVPTRLQPEVLTDQGDRFGELDVSVMLDCCEAVAVLFAKTTVAENCAGSFVDQSEPIRSPALRARMILSIKQFDGKAGEGSKNFRPAPGS
ncbi:MAG: hypothetical protein ABIK89_13225, partial [Planctomycetota bacterium]